MCAKDGRQIYDLQPEEFYIEGKTELEGENILYDLVPITENRTCPLCGCDGKKHGIYGPREVRDLPISLAQVGLRIKAHRYQCKECGNTWVNEYESIDTNAKITNRMREHIRNKSLSVPFKQIADELSISETTVKRIFTDYIAELDKQRELVAPEVLGIDENHLMNVYRAVFVDIKNRKLIDILPKRSKQDVKKFLKELQGKENIKVVTMDMWKPYRDAVKEVLPNAVVVVDKFHVIKESTLTLERIRKDISKSIDASEKKYLRHSKYLLLSSRENLTKAQEQRRDELLARFPEFERPYRMKEMIRDIYTKETKEEALEWYENIKTLLFEYDELYEFVQVFSTIDNWKEEIFNYFDHQYTNAVTENINKQINEIGEAGRGYTFEVLRAKAIFKNFAKKPNKFEFPDK